MKSFEAIGRHDASFGPLLVYSAFTLSPQHGRRYPAAICFRIASDGQATAGGDVVETRLVYPCGRLPPSRSSLERKGYEMSLATTI